MAKQIACILLLATIGSVAAKTKLTLGLTRVFTPEVAEVFAEAVTGSSDGELTIEVVVRDDFEQAFKDVQKGRVDMLIGNSRTWNTGAPGDLFFNVPFGMNLLESRAFYNRGPGKELLANHYKQFGLLARIGFDIGTQTAGWTNFAVDGVQDLEVPVTRNGAYGPNVLERIVKNYTNLELTAEEYGQAMADGEIQGVEFVNPKLDTDFGIAEAAIKEAGGLPWYLNYPAWVDTNLIYLFVMNQDVFDHLPKKFQHLILIALDGAMLRGMDQQTDDNARALNDIKEAGIEIRELPTPFLQTLKITAEKVLKELVQEDGTGEAKKILDDYAEYLNFVNPWSQITYAKSTSVRKDIGTLFDHKHS